jgi:chemotaxis protein methyltransferase CheR
MQTPQRPLRETEKSSLLGQNGAKMPDGQAAHSPELPFDSTFQIIDDWDYQYLRQAVRDLIYLDLEHYKTRQMQRRLATLLVRRKAQSWPQYVEWLRQDPLELTYFQEYLTINVSSFYRDAHKWEHLVQHVLPGLLAQNAGGIQVWSAGCSIGAEPYTLAMLLQELSPRQSHRIWATDIDEKALARARDGGPYPAAEVKELPPNLIEKYLVPEEKEIFRVNSSLQKMIQFQKFDLLQGRVERQFDLIVCRNVVIYFTPEVKSKLYASFWQALRSGGVLFIGGTETIAHHREMNYEYMAPSLYRRPALAREH